ncbi:CDP-alcohol phosphatidyltransferase family protein [Candidatus Roizmanbacteria bacterium]|nr:CDP-alcohol phosphatidyltransferase family protein [Candidatus Roizmanbacteria bacterium]
MATKLKETQNSPLRRIFTPITDGTAKLLIKAIPGIKADHITYAGLGLTVLGSFARFMLPEKLLSASNISTASLGLMLFGVLCDGIDGAVARNVEKPPGYHELEGMLTDVVHNRLGETAMAASRIFAAGLRRDPIGIFLATVSGITSPLPSVFRALSEAEGSKVDESGNNPIAKLGTRVPRAIFAISSTAFPQAEINDATIPIQPIADLLSTAGNIAALVERYNVLKRVRRGEIQKNLSENDQYFGAERAKRLKPYSAVNALILLGSATASLMLMMK